MWEEESERGGYLPLDDVAMNTVASVKNVIWKQNVKAESSSPTFTKVSSPKQCSHGQIRLAT